MEEEEEEVPLVSNDDDCIIHDLESDGWSDDTMRNREESAQELIVDTMDGQFSDGFRSRSVLSHGALVVFICLVGFFLIRQIFPDLEGNATSWGRWANEMGNGGAAAFALVAGVVMLIPGVPGSLLCFTCGAVFPSFKTGLLVAISAHHLGACLAFGIARFCLRGHFEKLLATRPTLHTMSRAVTVEAYKVTFLSRFIVIPVQLKNYLFGVLPVSFRCFFSMALLGDLQSAVFTVYLGSVSTTLLVDHPSLKATEDSFWTKMEGFLPVVSLIVAATMTTIASIVARRSYVKVLADIQKGLVDTEKQIEITIPSGRNSSMLRSLSHRSGEDGFVE